MFNFRLFLQSGVRASAIALLLSSCSIGEEDPGPIFPVLSTTDVSNITRNSVTIGGTFLEEGQTDVIDKGIVWAPIGTPVHEGTMESAGAGKEDFTVTIIGLEPSTTYRARAYRSGGGTTGFGDIREFTTLE